MQTLYLETRGRHRSIAVFGQRDAPVCCKEGISGPDHPERRLFSSLDQPCLGRVISKTIAKEAVKSAAREIEVGDPYVGDNKNEENSYMVSKTLGGSRQEIFGKPDCLLCGL